MYADNPDLEQFGLVFVKILHYQVERVAAFFVIENVTEHLAQRFTPLWVRALAGQGLERWLRKLSAGVIGRTRKVAWSEAQAEDSEIRTFPRRQITSQVWSGTSGVEDKMPAVGEGMFSLASRMREIHTSGLTREGEETQSGKSLRHRLNAKAVGNC